MIQIGINRLSILALLILGAAAAETQQTGKQHVNYERGSRWLADNDGFTRVPVCWENPDGFDTETSWVRDAIRRTWSSVAKIEFTGWGRCSHDDRGVRILIKDSRSKSYIGRYLDGARGGMELNFTFRNIFQDCQDRRKREGCIRSIAVHEFGHAVGFAHEQDRSDTPRTNDRCMDERSGLGGLFLTPYDADSVLNYCNPNWNNGGVLSEFDIQGIQTLYGKRDASPRPSRRDAKQKPESRIGVLNWTLTENHGGDIYLKFYSATRSGHTWPQGNKVYALGSGATKTFRIEGLVGERVCFGAWDSNGCCGGVGKGNAHGCANCCAYLTARSSAGVSALSTNVDLDPQTSSGSYQRPAFPAFCCTSHGKFGPYYNTMIPEGGACYGVDAYFRYFPGSACY